MLNTKDRRRLLRLLTNSLTADVNTDQLASLAGVSRVDASEYRDEFDQAMLYALRELRPPAARPRQATLPTIIAMRRSLPCSR